LEACANDAPHADEQGMWGVLRYVPGSEEEPGDEPYAAGRDEPDEA
ncbi:MAG: GTP-binding protein, partial [Catenulispora sp.]|nr:GTP-binding protein [Catenulispora sp.]